MIVVLEVWTISRLKIAEMVFCLVQMWVKLITRKNLPLLNWAKKTLYLTINISGVSFWVASDCWWYSLVSQATSLTTTTLCWLSSTLICGAYCTLSFSGWLLNVVINLVPLRACLVQQCYKVMLYKLPLQYIIIHYLWYMICVCVYNVMCDVWLHVVCA